MEYHSVHVLSPDNDPCIILRWSERNRILPIWIEETEAFAIAARDEDEQFGSRRPLTHDLLIHALSRIGNPVVELRIVSYHEGVFLVPSYYLMGKRLIAVLPMESQLLVC